MTVELGQTQDPKILVPGDVGAVTGTLWSMRSYGDSLREAGTGLARIDTHQGWRGEAADQFRSRFDGEPRKWTEAGDCFHSAADALDSYASTLQWAQQEAGEAIRLWNEAEAATANAWAEHERTVRRAQEEATGGTVPDIPFNDPGEAKREAARQRLSRARNQLSTAGDTAERTVGAARDRAPEKPGFWSRVGDTLGDIGDGLLDVGAGVVNGLASFGNAMINHPGDVALAAAGIALTTVSAAGGGLGIALDATGVGAVAGVPLNAVSTAGIAAGATMTAAAVGDLTHHAMTDDQVSPVQHNGGSGGTGGRSGTKTDRLKEHLTDRDLDAARRELNGEVVARKPNGQPWDHVDEVRNAQRGLVNRINQIRRQLDDSRLAESDRAALESELAEASRLLDHSEGFVPRP
jgi:Bacterial toxin 28